MYIFNIFYYLSIKKNKKHNNSNKTTLIYLMCIVYDGHVGLGRVYINSACTHCLQLKRTYF